MSSGAGRWRRPTRIHQALMKFLRARLDEAESAVPGMDLEWGETAADNDLDERRARALREITGKRNILARYEDCLARQEDDDYPATIAADQAREYEDFVLPNAALAWNDHPDYQQEWKP